MLTYEANSHIAQIHHRMPVLLDDQTCQMWLDQTKTYAECFHAICDSDIVKKGNPDSIKIVQVSNSVSSIKNQGADCILPKAEFDEKQFKTQGLGRFFAKVSSAEQDK